MFMLLLYFSTSMHILMNWAIVLRLRVHVTCYSVTRVHVTCYSDSVTVLLNMLLGYCIYVYAYMLHTCYSVPLNGWKRLAMAMSTQSQSPRN